MEDAPNTRQSLLVRLGDSRDERAWGEFVAIYGPLVHRLARQRGLQEADASDVVQDVFRSVAQAFERGDYKPERGSFRGWLFRIARNLMINVLTRQRHQARGTGDTVMKDLLEAQPAPAGEETAQIESAYKRRLLYWASEQVRDEFSDATWAAFWAAGVEGKRAKDVAETLGTTVGAVYRCKSRVMARIRAKIEEIEGQAAQDAGSD